MVGTPVGTHTDRLRQNWSQVKNSWPLLLAFGKARDNTHTVPSTEQIGKEIHTYYWMDLLWIPHYWNTCLKMEMCNSQDQFQETDECISIHKSNWQMIQGGQKRKQLDESTARRHLKSPGHYLVDLYLHLTLVTKWSRSHMTLKIQISMSWPRSNPLSHLRPRVQIDMFASHFVAIRPLLVEM